MGKINRAIFAVLITVLFLCINGDPSRHFTVMAQTQPPDPDAPDADFWETFALMMTEQREGDCTLPCWWGLIPGESTLDDIIHLLNETGIVYNRNELYESLDAENLILGGEGFHLDFSDNNSPYPDWYIAFWVDEGVLRKTYISFLNLDMLTTPALDAVTLPAIVQMIDESPEIYMGNRSQIPNLRLYVIYPQAGVWLSYGMNLEGYDWDGVNFCFDFSQTQGINLELMAPDDPEFIEPYQRFVNADNILAFDEVFKHGVDELVDRLRADPPQCLQTAAQWK